MPTIRDVAKLAGVSVATVSRVINEAGYVSPELGRRVRDAISTLGYQPNVMARHLRRSESLTLGILIPDSSNPFFAEMAKGVEDLCFERGLNVVLCNTHESAEKASLYFNILYQHRVAGFIVVSPEGLTEQMQQLIKDGHPLVLADRPVSGVGAASVVSDNYGGGCQAMRHLLDLGHRRLGILLGSRTLETIKARWAGALSEIQKAGAALEPELVYDQADYMPRSGYEGAAALMERPNPPTAIFAFNDLMALGVLSYAHEHGIAVPGQLSVIGFDDITIASYSVPTLTTIAQPKYELGRTVAEILVRQIGDERSNGRAPESVVLPTSLVVRESTAPPAERSSK